MNHKQIAKQLIELAEQLVERVDPATMKGLYVTIGHEAGDAAWVMKSGVIDVKTIINAEADNHATLWPGTTWANSWYGRYDKKKRVVTILPPDEPIVFSVPSIILSKLQSAFPDADQFLVRLFGGKWTDV